MRELSIFRRAALAGALAFSLTSMAAAVDGAQAMPVAATLGQQVDAGSITTVQYMRYSHYRYRRFNQGRRAGLYRCGRGGLSTHLERKACR